MKRRTHKLLLVSGLGLILVTILAIVTTAIFNPPAVSASPSDTSFFIATEGVGSVDVHSGATPGSSPGEYVVSSEFIVLEAKSVSPWQFAGWSPVDIVSPEEINEPLITIEASSLTDGVTITAKFVRCYTLNPVVFSIPSKPDSGTITATDTSIDPLFCSGENQYDNGRVIQLVAAPGTGFEFQNWSGNVTPGGSPTLGEITMEGSSSDITVSATFIAGCRTLNLESSEGGSDPIPDKDASDGCLGQYKGGDTINLTATPDEGNRVEEWIGKTSINPGNPNKATLVMPFVDIAHTVRVNYGPAKPIVQFSSNEYTVNEDVDGAKKEITLIRTGNTDVEAKVLYTIGAVGDTAESGQDYGPPVNGDVTIPAGQTEGSFFVNIINDSTTEETESVTLKLQEFNGDTLVGDPKEAVLFIINDDKNPSFQFELPGGGYIVPEIDTTFPVTVTLSPPSTSLVGVRVKTIDGTATGGGDFIKISNKNLFFFPGDQSEIVEVTILHDTLKEADETFKLMLFGSTGPELGEPNEAVITIIDDDGLPTVQFSSDEYIAQAGDNAAEVSVTLSEATGQTVSVEYLVTGSSGQSTGTVDIPTGEIAAKINIPIAGAGHGDEYFLQLGNVENASKGEPQSAHLTVLNYGPEACHELKLTYSGYGSPPVAVDLNNSLGCDSGKYVDGELISILAQPDPGWFVAGWQGTTNDNALDPDQVVLMPDNTHLVTADYHTGIFLGLIRRSEFYQGDTETEPNDQFVEANGPIQFDTSYTGSFADESDTEDRYYFVLTTRTKVQITLNDIPKGSDYDMLLYDENWADGHIDASTEFDNTPEIISKTLQPGKYYVRILRGDSDSSSQKYKLRITES